VSRPLSFETTLVQDEGGTWWYAQVPRTVREQLGAHARRGFIPVVATIGETSWDATLMPWADGSAQIVVKREVRERESLGPGQALQVSVRPRG
jgi:Domain of unknown function (DUF1905)